MDLLEHLSCTTSMDSRPGNAQLSSERVKDEMITILGG